MHELVSFNHQISRPQDINLHPISSAALYGKGVFTTVAVYRRQPFLWNKHWKRLAENAEKLAIDLTDFSESAVKKTLYALLEKNETFNARARITFFDESSSEIWKVKNRAKTSFLITTADLRNTSEKLLLTVSPYPVNSRSPLVNIKSCNYLENVYAFQEARKKGFDEAIRLNEKNEIASACLANIFWVRDEKIFTPSVKTGILPGTTREFIMEEFDVFEINSTLKEIEKAETVFLTSAGIGIKEVRKFGKIEYKSTQTFLKIKSLFERIKKNPQD